MTDPTAQWLPYITPLVIILLVLRRNLYPQPRHSLLFLPSWQATVPAIRSDSLQRLMAGTCLAITRRQRSGKGP